MKTKIVAGERVHGRASEGRSETAAGLMIFRRVSGRPVEYLLLQASYPNHAGGRDWTPPKGKREGSEEPIDTAFRESREETRLPRDILELVSSKPVIVRYSPRPGVQKEVSYFLAELSDVNHPIGLSIEHQNFEWAEFSTARRLLRYTDLQEGLEFANDFINRLAGT